MIKTFTLHNGIQVVTYHLPQVKSLHISACVKSGSLMEDPKANGVAHFMEHLLVQGIPSLPTAQQIALFLENLAGRYNAYTSELLVSFGLSLPYRYMDDALRITSEVMFEPLFKQEALDRDRRAVLTEALQKRDSVNYKLHSYFKKTRYTSDTKLQQDTVGDPDAIEKMTLTDIKKYWDTFFAPNNTFLLIGGNFDNDQLQKTIEKYFSKYKKREFPKLFTNISPDILMPSTIAIREDATLQTNYLDISFPSISQSDPVQLLLKQRIALIILSGLRTSRLQSLLRYQKGLVYGVSAYGHLRPHVGMVGIDSEVTTIHVEEVLQIIVEEVKKYIAEGPTQEELDRIKTVLTNQWLMVFDEPSDVGDWVASEFLWHDKIAMPEEYIEMLKEITVENIIAFMKKYWDFSKTQIILQGPWGDTPEHKKFLTQMLSQLTLQKNG